MFESRKYVRLMTRLGVRPQDYMCASMEKMFYNFLNPYSKEGKCLDILEASFTKLDWSTQQIPYHENVLSFQEKYCFFIKMEYLFLLLVAINVRFDFLFVPFFSNEKENFSLKLNEIISFFEEMKKTTYPMTTYEEGRFSQILEYTTCILARIDFAKREKQKLFYSIFYKGSAQKINNSDILFEIKKFL